MSIWGKLIGGATGLALGGPIGAILGIAAGHGVDKVSNYNTTNNKKFSKIEKEKIPALTHAEWRFILGFGEAGAEGDAEGGTKGDAKGDAGTEGDTEGSTEAGEGG